MKRQVLSVLLAFLCVCSFATAAFGQTDRGSITGRVTDPAGAVVPDAKVKITNLETGAAFETTTSQDGRYATPAIFRPGRYRVEVSQQGFKTAVSEETVLQIGDVKEVNLRLEVGAVVEQVVVTTEAVLLETETSNRGEVITGREITELPLKDRNFTQLATLTPGVNRVITDVLSDQTFFNQGDPNAGSVPGVGDSRGRTEAARFSRSGGASISANGLRPTNNNFSLDGVDNNEPQFGSIGVFPNPDAIAEFKVETTNAKAEVGRGGATINTTFKSGTNDFHGSVYYYGKNDAFNATPWLINRNRGGLLAGGLSEEEAEDQLPKSKIRGHEFGFTIGGPIIKNRTFFFFDYLGQRNSLPHAFQTVVPTARSREGDFSEWLGSATVNDPATGTPFPGNVIPNLQSRADFSPQAFALLALYPLPNGILNPGQPPTFGNPNFFGERGNEEDIDNFDIKVDHRFSDKNSIAGRYSRQDLTRVRGNFFPNVPTAGFGAGEEVGDSRQLVISNTHIFRPTLLNEFRFGWTRTEIGIFNCGVGGSCGIPATACEDLGIPNCNKGTLATTGGILTGGFGTGEFEFTGDGGLFLVKSDSFYVADSVTIVSGNHSWKAGIEVRPRLLETIDGGRSGSLKGHLQYASAGSTSTGHVQADYLLNRPALNAFSGSILGGEVPFDLGTAEWSFFVQDDWKATPNLTFNAGLRYEVFPGFSEQDARLANFDLATRSIIRAEGSGDSIIDTDSSNFGPRLGFAWAFGAERQFVLRGGYGLFYSQDGVDYPPLIRNPPLTSSVGLGVFSGDPRVFNLTTGPPVAPLVDPPVITGGTILFVLEPDQKTASIHEWNLTLQWQFARDWLVDIGYVGTRGRNLIATRQIGNQNNGLGLARAPNGDIINNVTAYENRASSQYDGLQTKLEKRYSHGILMRMAYTWSHSIDDSTGVFLGAGDERGSEGGPINPFSFRGERANSTFDFRHVFSTNLIWDLPFGRGKTYLAEVSPTMDKVVGGWQANFIWRAESGQPFGVRVDSSSGGVTRPDVLCDDPTAGAPDERFFNPACFGPPSQSVVNLAGKTVVFGTLGRNAFTGPGRFRTDFSLFKNTPFGPEGRYTVQFGIEFFNLFNQTHNFIPNNNFSDLGGFGRFDNALPPRTIQYRLKLLF